MNIYEKLAKARKLLKEKGLKQSGNNKFAGYTYFDLADILPATTEIELQLGMLSVVGFDDTTAKLALYNTEKPDEYITFTSPMSTATLKGCHDVQNLGAVETYIRRYLYLIAYEIVETEALDLTQGDTQKAPAKAKEDKTSQNEPKHETQASDITLEQAEKLYFKSGKNANIPFKELPTNTLEWVSNNMTGTFKTGADLIINSRNNTAPSQPKASKQTTLMTKDDLQPIEDSDLPF